MFHSFGYRGHTIHIAIPDRSSVEEIKVQLRHDDGGFDLVPCKTLLGAKRRITRYVRDQGKPDQPAGAH
ncbi:hypothetical protein BBJ41_00775 [Burkholderia stabilis]|uniref:hypothetical protein n=1 Tax=Burkholderia cepacia complex TaxID=87882 RepID=UPI000851AC76|nr:MULTISPECIES: hypothetical protein [Burkholderia cepacia complex]AOR66199.1 hypothetical protein BBJ41_00775 [Burkholderia stabilis]PRG26947.1 hypothetical protein C6T62_26715 [Burkholderia multivorans]HDR9491995.1 hypothetical protein [Burkholderia stabilis]HDR9523971.1 hypothetical protein [Burkholderia stabilis]HDR9530722.1 hypothetical protein [Burkholderia stabilis]